MFEDEIPLGKAKNLAGQRFSKLTALYRVANQGKCVTWKCRCDCGNEIDVRANNLLSGHSASCGCLRRETLAKRANDLTNMRFGRLVALYPTEERTESHHVIWHCVCDCGNEKNVSADDLRRGDTQSCGCLRRETLANRAIDLTNKRFGRLVALYPTEERSGGNVVWHCVCDCGNTTLVSTDHLRSGDTQSCGCISSYGEERIAALCRENNLLYEQQKMFETCRFEDTGRKARFDFYINQNYLIEFDGIQHFICSGKDWNTLENFEQTQIRDAYKNQWCKDNNIPLIRIPYTKLDTLCIEDLLLETTQFRVI